MAINWGTFPEWVQMFIAGAGLFGLWKYTSYTRDIRTATLNTQRSAIEPVLICKAGYPDEHKFVPIMLHNVGQGASLDSKIAIFQSDPRPGGFFDLTASKRTDLGDLGPGDKQDYAARVSFPDGTPRFLIVEGEDITGVRHQLYVRLEWIEDKHVEPYVSVISQNRARSGSRQLR